MRGLVFVETSAQAQLVGERSMGKGADVVALTPMAAYELEHRDIPFTQPHDYVAATDWERVGDVNLRRTERLTEMIDVAITSTLGGDHPYFRPAYCEFFRLKVLMDALGLRVQEIVRIIDAKSPSQVTFFDYSPHQTQGRLDFMAEPIYSRLIPRVAAAAGVPVAAHSAEAWDTAPAEWGRRFRIRRVAETLASLALPALGGLRTRRDATSILVLDSTLVQRLVTSRAHRVIVWRAGSSRALALGRRPMILGASPAHGYSIATSMDRAWSDFSSSVGDDLFMQDGLELKDLLEPKLHHLFRQIVPAHHLTYQRAANAIRNWNVALVFASSFSEGSERAVAQAAHATGVPVVAYDHGAEGYFHFPIDEHLDSGIADYRLVWGEGVRRQVLRRYAKGAEPITVGAATLDPLLQTKAATRRSNRSRLLRRLGFDDSRKVVVYCATNLTSHMRYASRLIVPDNLYFANQLRILRVLLEFPRHQLLLKIHPSTYYPRAPIENFLRDQGRADVRIVSEVPLSEVLDIADLFVNDSPTTTLLQMLTSPAPVIAFTQPAMELEADCLEALSGAAFVTDKMEVLERELRRRLESGSLDGERDPTAAFLKDYGTYLNDGKSAQRVVAAIQDIALRGPMPVGADAGAPSLS